MDAATLAQPVTLLDGRVVLYAGDCSDVLRALPRESIDSVVTDPPYHLTSIVKRFGPSTSGHVSTEPKIGVTGAYARAAAGFMGQAWDGGDIAFRHELWAEVLRVLKPGGHLLAFSGTRTYHRMACAIEDAGFEIRDLIAWMYGSGFPKSHDVAKAIDKSLGAQREKKRFDASEVGNFKGRGDTRPWIEKAKEQGFYETDSDLAASAEAAEWYGWGTALKPALEPICFARKPLGEKTVAANVLKHGTGAINIDQCRVEGETITPFGSPKKSIGGIMNGSAEARPLFESSHLGRWPANVVHDGSDEVIGAFPHSNGGGDIHRRSSPKTQGILGAFKGNEERFAGFNDKGSAARFFYSAKADADDRIGSKHPTVKPVDLMQWLVRLITPPGGTVLDPFAGTGTTGEAAFREGFRAVLIEREDAYRADIARRMALCSEGPVTRKHESVKARGLAPDAGPLFGGADAPAGQTGSADRSMASSPTKAQAASTEPRAGDPKQPCLVNQTARPDA